MSHMNIDYSFEWLKPEDFSEDSAWWSIYQQSFPPKELDDKNQLLDALQHRIVKIGCHRRQDETLAIAVVYPLQAIPCAFLHYFAVAKNFRCQGLGGKLFKGLVHSVPAILSSQNNSHFGLVFEVEDPAAATSLDAKTICEQRIQFYKRHGAHLFKHSFIQPAINGTHTVMMRLMYCAPQSNANIHASEKSIAEAIYIEKYQRVNAIPKEIISSLLRQCHSSTY